MCGLPLRQSTPRASSTSVSRPATDCLIAFVGTKRPSAASVIPAPIPAHLRGKFGFTRLGRNARDGIPVGLLLLRAVGFRCALPAAGREESIELVLVIDDAFAELVVGGWEARHSTFGQPARRHADVFTGRVRTVPAGTMRYFGQWPILLVSNRPLP